MGPYNGAHAPDGRDRRGGECGDVKNGVLYEWKGATTFDEA